LPASPSSRYRRGSYSAQDVDGAGGRVRAKYQSTECSLYLGVALIGVKDYRQAKAQLESAAAKSESLGARALLARSHYLLGEALRLAGDSATAAGHYTKARQTLDEIKSEARTDALLARYDLKPILQAPAR
jgi:tetratricopeptide (TPR) repeat protein